MEQQQNRTNKLKQDKNHRPNSRQRLQDLQKQEQYLSEAFKIDNFYNDDKLDILTLKNKINEIRKKGNNGSSKLGLQLSNNPQQNNRASSRYQDNQTPKQVTTLVPLSNRIQKLYSTKKSNQRLQSRIFTGRQTASSSKNPRNCSSVKNNHLVTRKRQNSSNQIEQGKVSANWSKLYTKTPLGQFQKNYGNSRYQSIQQYSQNKSKNLEEQPYGQLRSTIIPKIQKIGRRQNLLSKNSQQKTQSMRKALNLSRLQPLSSYKRNLTKIKIEDNEKLKQFEMNILSVWSLYQKLGQIVKRLSYSNKQMIIDSVVSQQFVQILCEYKQLVCSTRYEFIVNIIDNCIEFGQSKSIVLSRLLQNLSIIYILLQIVEQAFGNSQNVQFSHLVNFVGIASHNLLLLLRLIALICIIDEQLTISQSVLSIFKTISQFQIQSFREELSSVRQTSIRIDHNNDLMLIIQAKLNARMSSKNYHISSFGKFMKGVLIDRLKNQIQIAGDKNNQSDKSTIGQTKTFFQYSYFIFQYLAFILHHQKCVGLFPKQIQTAPQPYLPLKKEFTIILDPRKVLVHESKSKYFVRAHTQKFLSQLSQKCNIVFWSEKMPSQVDSIFDLVDLIPSDIRKLTRNQIFMFTSSSSGSRKSQIKRLYGHHCFNDYNGKDQVRAIKDILKMGCPRGKYLILDSNMDNYYAQQQIYTILIPWKGQPKDAKLLTVLDFLLPFLREGTDLSKGMKLLKPRLQQILRIKKKKQK